MSDRLSAATQLGGRADGWPEDVWSLIVWAAIGSGDWPDSAPETDIADQRQRGGDPETVLASLASTLDQQPVSVILACAWSGLARVAKERRDAAIRAVQHDVSDRQIARVLGLSHPAVGAIRQNPRRQL